jgi:tetratricopeptide (TPR) repeat protein
MKVWFSVVAILFYAVVACQADESADIGAQGMLAFKGRDYDHAIMYFSRAIDLNTNYVGAYYYRGLSYMAKNQFDKSIADFGRAVLLNTNYADAYYFRGVCYMNEKKYQQSLADLDKSLLLQTNSGTLMVRAYVYTCVTNYNGAIEDYNKAVHLNPVDIQAYLGRARAFILDGAFGLAIMDCNSALALNPYSVSAYQERGQAYENQGDFDNAIADYNRAIQLNSGDSVTYYARGEAFADTGKFSNAIPDFTIFIASNTNDSAAYSQRGWCRDETGDYAGALDDYQKAIAVDANSAWGYNNLAWELAVCPEARFRDGEKALVYAKKACELTDWKNPAYIDTLAAANAEAGNFTEAIKWEEEALKGLSDKDLPEGQKALNLYKQGKPYHEEPNKKAP